MLVAVTHHSGLCRTSKLSRRPKNYLKTAKKTIFFRENVEIWGVSREISLAVEMSNRYFRSRVTPPVDLNEILYYFDQMFMGCHLSPQMFTGNGVHSSAIMGKLPYMAVRQMPDRKFWRFFAYLGHKNEKSPSPRPKCSVHDPLSPIT
jgi:hypothetical protein